MINKHRTPAIDKKKLPMLIVTPQDAVQENNSIVEIGKAKNKKRKKRQGRLNNERRHTERLIPEKASIVSTATKPKDTVTIPNNAAEPVKLLSPEKTWCQARHQRQNDSDIFTKKLYHDLKRVSNGESHLSSPKE